jgi:hypothetical protein
LFLHPYNKPQAIAAATSPLPTAGPSLLATPELAAGAEEPVGRDSNTANAGSVLALVIREKLSRCIELYVCAL